MASTPIKDFTSPWTKTTKEKKNQKNLLRIIKSSRSPEYSEEANKRSVDRGKRVYSFVTQHKRNYRRMGASEGGGRDGPRGEVGGGVFGWERSVGRAELLIPFQRLVRSSETGAPGESGVKSKIIAKRKTAARIRGRKSERRKVGKGEGGGRRRRIQRGWGARRRDFEVQEGESTRVETRQRPRRGKHSRFVARACWLCAVADAAASSPSSGLPSSSGAHQFLWHAWLVPRTDAAATRRSPFSHYKSEGSRPRISLRTASQHGQHWQAEGEFDDRLTARAIVADPLAVQ